MQGLRSLTVILVFSVNTFFALEIFTFNFSIFLVCGLKGNKEIRSDTYDFGDVIPNINDTVLVEGQVFGGKSAKEAEWPWIVYVDLCKQTCDNSWNLSSQFLLINLDSGGLSQGQGFCGGSLLSPNTVVTAAHCTTMSVLVSCIMQQLPY